MRRAAEVDPVDGAASVARALVLLEHAPLWAGPGDVRLVAPSTFAQLRAEIERIVVLPGARASDAAFVVALEALAPFAPPPGQPSDAAVIAAMLAAITPKTPGNGVTAAVHAAAAVGLDTDTLPVPGVAKETVSDAGDGLEIHEFVDAPSVPATVEEGVARALQQLERDRKPAKRS
jgi:hypothetical protein